QAQQRWLTHRPQVTTGGGHVLQADVVSRHRRNAHQRVAEGIDRKTQEREQVSYFIPLEEATQVEHWNTTRLQTRRDLVQPRVGAAEHRLLVQGNAIDLEVTDGRRDTRHLVLRRVEAPNLRPRRSRPA